MYLSKILYIRNVVNKPEVLNTRLMETVVGISADVRADK